uniref:Ig-like domain-containing protein n=1 Tax=Sus scrofa TaxID=9823 RepID=I3LI31_PIG
MKSSRVLLVILWLQLPWTKSQQKGVEQSPASLPIPEGANASLNCNYSDSASDYFMWYRQAPQLLLKGSTANPRPKEQGFQATLVKSDKTFHLQKRSVQTSDSAVYYCALSDTVRGAAGGTETYLSYFVLTFVGSLYIGLFPPSM